MTNVKQRKCLMTTKRHTKEHLSCPDWLCVQKAYGYFLFFMNEFIQSEDNIYTSEGDGEKKQRWDMQSPLTFLEKSRCIFLMNNKVPPKG